MLRVIWFRIPFGGIHAAAGLATALGFFASCGTQALAEQSAETAQTAPNLQQISKTPERWPETISVVVPVAVDLAMNGRKVGQATVQPSQKLKVVGIENGKVLVAVGSIVTALAPEQTNFWESYDARQQELAAEKPASAVAQPAEAPVAPPSQPAATPGTPAALPRIGGSAQTAQLTRRQAEKNESGGLSIVAGRYYQPLSSAPSSLKSEPECTSPAYFEISIAGQQVPLVVDFSDPGRAKVFFDPKGAGDLRAAKPLSGQNTVESRGGPQAYGQYEIGPLVMEAGLAESKKGTPFKLLVTRTPTGGASQNRQGYLRVVPVEHFSGTATLAGRKVDVILVDSDFDGKLSPGFRAEYVQGRSSGPPPPFDCIGIDWNGDHQFDYRSEVLPLVSFLGFGGQQYELTPAANSASLGIREAQPEWGALEKTPDVALVLVSEKSVVLLDSGDAGKWKVPADDYSTSYFRLSSKKGGADWTIHGNKPGPGLEKIAILPGQTTALKMGVPLTPKFEVSWRGDDASIGFSLGGVGGETYEAGGRMGGNRQPPPDFKILNRDGKVLARGTFEYG